MPFKAQADRRHHIPKEKHRVTNWAEYDAALRARGSLTVWFTPEAVTAWAAAPRTTRGGQPCYSDLAIATALTLRAVFRLALRQAEGLIGSVIALLGLDLPVPDHSTLSRRAETLEVPRPTSGPSGEPVHLLVDSTGLRLCGPGEWLTEKHGSVVVHQNAICLEAEPERRGFGTRLRRATPPGSATGGGAGRVGGPYGPPPGSLPIACARRRCTPAACPSRGPVARPLGGRPRGVESRHAERGRWLLQD